MVSWSRIGRDMTERLLTEVVFGEEVYVGRLLHVGKECKDICLPYKYSPKMILAEENFNNQVFYRK